MRLGEDELVLWLNGKPGAGKVSHERLSQCLEPILIDL
jgi:hypothetical protein